MMTPTERILSALTDRNCNPKRNGKGWSARCPAHDDRRPSLSVSEGDDGRALVFCQAGCATAEALAISPRKLWAITASGEIPHIRLGRCKRYLVADLKSWIES